jgi:hypothetical protein
MNSSRERSSLLESFFIFFKAFSSKTRFNAFYSKNKINSEEELR